MMRAGTPEADATLDDLLIRWWQSRPRINPSRGFNDRATVVGDYLISRQHDDTNGSLYDDEEAGIMRCVEREIVGLEQLHRIAICAMAQALTLGWEVFHHERLPFDLVEREKLGGEARAALTLRLISAGVM